jgi:DNA-binding transcriptional LysR family regulator
LRAHAEILLGQAEVARRAVGDLLRLRRGQLTVGAIPSVSACLFPTVVAGFRVRHPGVDLCLLEGTSEQVGAWVEEGRVQLGVVQLPAGSGRCFQTPLFSEPFLLLVPATHGLARKQSVSLKALAAESFIFYRGRVRDVVEGACRSAGFEPRVACETGELETIRSLVAAGLGVALLPRLALGRVAEGCRVVGLSGMGVKREVAVLRRSEDQFSAESQEFQRLLCAELGSKGLPISLKSRR